MTTVAVVDSGAPVSQADWLMNQQRFMVQGNRILRTAVVEDALGHGSAVMDILRFHLPEVNIINVQVLDEHGRCHVQQLVAALVWLQEKNIKHIHLSVGLRRDDEALRTVCETLVSQDKILVASSPMLGGCVFPAHYPGVFSVAGDARCTVEEWSWFQGQHLAEFGAHVRGVSGQAGSSMAAAHLSGHIAAYRCRYPQATRGAVAQYLHEQASRKGQQKREPR